MSSRLLALLALGLSVGCGDDEGGPAAADSAPPADATVETDGGPDASPAPDAGPPLPEWPASAEPTSRMGQVRGLGLARAIIHAHSVYSHDACDDMPHVDGRPNEPCLADFRRDVCAAAVDVVMLTEHDALMADGTFEDVISLRTGDERVEDATGNLIAKRVTCADGARVLVTLGGENDLMPVGLVRHPVDSAGQALHDAYDANDAAAIDVFRTAGALVLVPHSEQRPVEWIRERDVDGMEIYNLHANLGPDIRQEFLGLDPLSYVGDLLEFANERRAYLEPDLSFLVFFDENRPSLQRFDTLIAEGRRIAGTGGTDCHQNIISGMLLDGERGDSYRRTMRWFSNYLLVNGPVTPESVHEALDAGRLWVGFDAYGTPVGFDFFAAPPSGAPVEMGATAPVGSTLTVVVPTLSLGGIESQLAQPRIRARILRAEEGGAVEVVAEETDRLEHVVTEPGAYRAEIRIVPEHVRPYIARLADRFVREQVWVYSNPIWIE